MKKNILAGLFVFFFICGAAQSAGADETTWMEITSDDDVVGEWEGQFSLIIPANAMSISPETSLDLTMLMEYIKGKSLNITFTMDLDRFLTDMSGVAGMKKDVLWEMLVMATASDSMIQVGKKYYMYFYLTEEAEEFLFDSSKGEVLIDDSKSKIKMVFYEGLSVGFGAEGLSEIILYKK
jgi:hypothetical protein